MGLHLDERADGGFALFIDGDLQFDTDDEAIYHESLALPALCLAQPAQPCALRVLICGGGDGLALRECLRFPGVAHVDLVDYDPDVVALGRTRLAALNHHAFDDARVRVHIADAWEFLAAPDPYDVVLCDFTVPRRPEETRIFTREWYAKVHAALAPHGVAALNAVSPQATPEAFWCLRRTVRSAGLSALPYRVCIPSYRAQGYGVWAFLLASPQPLKRSHLRALHCPVPTRQADLSQIWRGARFAHRERHLETRVPLHTLADPCLLSLLLNPGSMVGSTVDPGGPARASALEPAPFDIDTFLSAIPVTHPYHTRTMIEALAEQVVGTVRALDLRRLVEALLARAAALPGDLLRELVRLRDYLRDRAARIEPFGAWSYKLFVTLVILLTLANAIAPDNAFGKGTAGLGHASMSRGYSGSFTGGRGFGSAGRTGRSSFGTAGSNTAAGHGTGSSFGAGRGSFGRSGRFGGNGHSLRSSFGVERTFGHNSAFSPSPPSLVGSGFRSSYGRGMTTDINGYTYPERMFSYCGSGFGHIHTYYVGHGGTPPTWPPPEEHRTLFAADDDMIVLDNGDVIITLSDTAYLLVTGGTVSLMNSKTPDPLLPLYSDPRLFQNIQAQIQGQQALAAQQITVRQDWLSWTGWTASLFPAIASDRAELNNLEDLTRRLDTALDRLGAPPDTLPGDAPSEWLELFVNGFALENGDIALRGPDNRWTYTDGKQLWSDNAGANDKKPCPPVLADALVSILRKLQREFTADRASDDNDLNQLASDLASLQNDLNEYQNILHGVANGDPSYEVDYGTDSISVSDAISRTQNDLDQNRRDTQSTQAERSQTVAGLDRLALTLARFTR